MTLHWRYECRTDLGVLALAGRLGAKSVPIFTGAIGWTLYRGTGPLILDATGVTEWTSIGQGAIIEAALQLAERGRRLEVAAGPETGAATIAANQHVRVPVHPDLTAALAAHGALPTAPDGTREWSSGGWPATGVR